MGDRPTSNFGYFPIWNDSTPSQVVVSGFVQPLNYPEGVIFANGLNRWRIRVEPDSNLSMSYSSDGGVTWSVKHLFTYQ